MFSAPERGHTQRQYLYPSCPRCERLYCMNARAWSEVEDSMLECRLRRLLTRWSTLNPIRRGKSLMFSISSLTTRCDQHH
jgi:hypothetical protein